MSKSELTQQLEREIYATTYKPMGVYCCFEVTIWFNGNERVDYMTYDTKGIFRCYEIKSTLSDFNSNAKKSFVGHYNYYVLTAELYNQVKDLIPKRIGVYVNGFNRKKSKYIEVSADTLEILRDSMIRSLSREANKVYQIDNQILLNKINLLKKECARNKKEYLSKADELREWERACIKLYGREEVRKIRDYIDSKDESEMK